MRICKCSFYQSVCSFLRLQSYEYFCFLSHTCACIAFTIASAFNIIWYRKLYIIKCQLVVVVVVGSFSIYYFAAIFEFYGVCVFLFEMNTKHDVCLFVSHPTHTHILNTKKESATHLPVCLHLDAYLFNDCSMLHKYEKKNPNSCYAA